MNINDVSGFMKKDDSNDSNLLNLKQKDKELNDSNLNLGDIILQSIKKEYKSSNNTNKDNYISNTTYKSDVKNKGNKNKSA